MEKLTETRVNGSNEKIIIEGKKTYPKGTIFTKLKFKRSERSNLIVGFASKNTRTGRIKGVREEDNILKRVCVVDESIAPNIILGVLYDVAMVPMKHRNGYVVIEAKPYKFKVVVEINYVRNAVYMVNVKFGNKNIIFDPKDGRKESSRSIEAVKAMLEERVDIMDKEEAIEDFLAAANEILKRYEQDGFYVKKGA